MRNSLIFTAVFFFAATSVAVPPAKDGFATDDERISYSIGMDIGQSMKQMPAKIDLAILMEGAKDMMEGKAPRVSAEDSRKLKQDLSKRVQEKRNAEQKKQGAANTKAGAAFLEKNKSKKGVTVTASGLQYRVLKKGDGKKPVSTDKVKVHYKGSLIDGTEFDSSYSRGKPTTFGVTQVIKGWVEGLQLMNVGSTYEFVIPAELAYGARGPAKIGANSTLVFEVELLGIE